MVMQVRYTLANNVRLFREFHFSWRYGVLFEILSKKFLISIWTTSHFLINEHFKLKNGKKRE